MLILTTTINLLLLQENEPNKATPMEEGEGEAEKDKEAEDKGEKGLFIFNTVILPITSYLIIYIINEMIGCLYNFFVCGGRYLKNYLFFFSGEGVFHLGH